MKRKFTKKIAKQIAEKSFDQTLDCIMGRQDSYYDFETPIENFEQNFTEDMEEMDIAVTPRRILLINSIYETLVEKGIKHIEKLYSKDA